MADFSFTPAATGIRPVPQTSLADMIGVARNAQAYQQSLQVNPLEVQKAQTELQRLQALTPLEIERANVETRVAAGTERPRVESAVSQAGTAAPDDRRGVRIGSALGDSPGDVVPVHREAHLSDVAGASSF